MLRRNREKRGDFGMSKAIVLVSLLLCAGASPAWAQSNNCVAPSMPAPLDASKESVERIRGMMAAAQSFIATSEIYQACLRDDLQAQKDQAQRDAKPFDPAIEAQVQAKVAANQKDKEKVGANVDIAVTAFKRACEGKKLNACK